MINRLFIQGKKNYGCIIVTKNHEPYMHETVTRLENLNGNIVLAIDWSITKYIIVTNVSRAKKQYIRVYDFHNHKKLIAEASNYTSLGGLKFSDYIVLQNLDII